MEEKKDIVIDLRAVILLFLALAVAFFIVKVVGYGSNTVAVEPVASNRANASSVKASSKPSVSKGGVELVIEDVRRVDGKTFVKVRMNNHRFDLSDPNITTRTTLSGVRAEAFESFSSQVGGHHVEGEFRFDGDLNGVLVVGITEDLSLEIELP